MGLLSAATNKRQQHDANAPVRDRAFAKRLRSWLDVTQDNFKIPEEEERLIESLHQSSLNKIKQSMLKDG